MTIRRGAYAMWRVTCSGCGNVDTFQADWTRDRLLEHMKRIGWKIYKLYEVWKHRCPTCELKKLAPPAYFERLHD